MTDETTPTPKPVEKLTPKAQADKLLEGLLKGKQVHEIFTENMRRQLLISGQPINHWEETFKLHIPMDNLTPSLCKELSMKLMALNEEATFHHAVAVTKVQLIKHGGEVAFRGKFNALVEEFRSKRMRIPAAKTLENMANIDQEEIYSAQTIAEVEAKFWKDILDHISTCRRLIENASMNIAVEIKATQNDAAIDRLATKRNGG